MKTATALITAAASIALAASPVLASPASAAPSAVRFLGGCRAQGKFANCVAGGKVDHPQNIHVHIIARPGQQVAGAWSMTCAKGSGHRNKSGTFSGWAGLKNNLYRAMGMPYLHPDWCTVAADGELSHSGALHIWVTAVN
jgi:hypothetical protein